jgi:hypothetical protein
MIIELNHLEVAFDTGRENLKVLDIPRLGIWDISEAQKKPDNKEGECGAGGGRVYLPHGG